MPEVEDTRDFALVGLLALLAAFAVGDFALGAWAVGLVGPPPDFIWASTCLLIPVGIVAMVWSAVRDRYGRAALWFIAVMFAGFGGLGAWAATSTGDADGLPEWAWPWIWGGTAAAFGTGLLFMGLAERQSDVERARYMRRMHVSLTKRPWEEGDGR